MWYDGQNIMSLIEHLLFKLELHNGPHSPTKTNSYDSDNYKFYVFTQKPKTTSANKGLSKIDFSPDISLVQDFIFLAISISGFLSAYYSHTQPLISPSSLTLM